MLVDTPEGIPSSIKLDTSNPPKVTVYRSGKITSKPRIKQEVFIHDSSKSNLPRALASLSSNNWCYWEEAEIPTSSAARPPRIKYMILHERYGRWYIDVLLSRSNYSRKRIDAIRRIELCKANGFEITGTILIIKSKDLILSIDPDEWPVDIAYCEVKI